MNEREFLNQINGKINIDRDLTYTLVNQLIEESEVITLTKQSLFRKLFNGIFRRTKQEKTAPQIIEDNLENILQQTNDQFLGILLLRLLQTKSTQHIIKEQFDVILKNFTERRK